MTLPAQEVSEPTLVIPAGNDETFGCLSPTLSQENPALHYCCKQSQSHLNSRNIDCVTTCGFFKYPITPCKRIVCPCKSSSDFKLICGINDI